MSTGSNNQPVIFNRVVGGGVVPTIVNKHHVVSLSTHFKALDASDAFNSLIVNSPSLTSCVCTFESYEEFVHNLGSDFAPGLSFETIIPHAKSDGVTTVVYPSDANMVLVGFGSNPSDVVISHRYYYYKYFHVVASDMKIYSLCKRGDTD